MKRYVLGCIVLLVHTLNKTVYHVCWISKGERKTTLAEVVMMMTTATTCVDSNEEEEEEEEEEKKKEAEEEGDSVWHKIPVNTSHQFVLLIHTGPLGHYVDA